MAIQSNFYSGTALEARTFPSTKHIATKQHMAVWLQQVSDDVWVQASVGDYQLINNGCVLNTLLNTATYDSLEVRVADEPNELVSSPSDITIAAGIADEIATVAGMEAEVVSIAADKVTLDSLYADKATLDSLFADKATLDSLYADKAALDSLYADKATLDSIFADKVTLDSIFADKVALDTLYANLATVLAASQNATNAQLEAWNAEAERMTADSYATEAVDVQVKSYTSNGDGTFTATNTGEFSSLHYSVKSSEYVGVPTTITPTLSGANTVVENGDIVITITNYSEYNTYTLTPSTGSAVRVTDTITLTAGAVDVDTPHTLKVKAQTINFAESLEATHNFTVQDAPFIPDTDAYIDVTGSGFNDTNFSVLGDELVTNGGFDSDSDWFTGTGFSISNGLMNVSNVDSFLTRPTVSILESGVLYKLTFDIVGVTGALRLYFGGASLTKDISATGSYEEYIVADGSKLQFTTSSSGFTGSIDNVSVKEITSGATDGAIVENEGLLAEGELIFDAITYTGNGTSQDIVTGIDSVDFTQPNNGSGFWHDRTAGDCTVKNDAGDIVASGTAVVNTSMVHIKSRSDATNNYRADGIRGVGRGIYTNLTNVENNAITQLSNFTDTGFALGTDATVNFNTGTYIAYQTQYTHIKWGVTNQSKKYIEAYNPITNEGMIMYEGSGTVGHEIPHSVGVEIDYANAKSLSSATNWSATRGDSTFLIMNSTLAETINTTVFGDITSTTVSVEGSNTNTSSNSYIMYYKAKSPTWSTGTYIGTGAAGNFIETRDSTGELRKPARVTLKSISAGGTYCDWAVIDNRRDTSDFIALNLSASEETSLTSGGITQGGFTLPDGALRWNATGATYLYMVEFDTKASALEAGGSYSFDQALYQSATVTKSDAEGDWNGTQADSFVTSSLPNVMVSANSTDILLQGEVIATDELYLGDGTDLEVVTATGATYHDSADTNPTGDAALTNGYNFEASTGNDYVGAIDADVTSTSFVQGSLGLKADLRTTTGKVSIPSTIATPKTAITIACKFTLTTDVADINIFGSGGNSGWYFMNIRYDTNGVYAGRGLGGTNAIQTAHIPISINVEYSAILDFTDGGNLSLTIIDSNGFNSTESVAGSPYTLSQTNVAFEAFHDGLLNRLSGGYIGTVKVYNKVLSADEKLEYHNQGKTKLTHNQSFTPTFACKKDNVSMDVSFDGTNYTTLTKSSAVADSAMVVANTANDEFETVLWAGADTGQTISLANISGDLDFVWMKGRLLSGWHGLYDTIRGAGQRLASNETAVEADRISTDLTAFGTGEFTVGTSYDYGSENYVAWCASLPTKSGVLGNTDGTIASTTMSNSFMSTVSYVGTGLASATIGHSLGKAPEMSIVKNRTTASTSWYVSGSWGRLRLNGTEATIADGYVVAHNATTLNTGLVTSETNNSGDNYIAYCFTSVEGLCKVGSYTGTGVAGNVVDCGFEPAWVMIKRTDGVEHWYIHDNSRGGNYLVADDSWAEAAFDSLDFTSSGFTLASTDASSNASGGTYIYLAIAKNSPEDLRIKELHDEYLETTNTGTDLAFKINHKEQDTKTSAVYAALFEGA